MRHIALLLALSLPLASFGCSDDTTPPPVRDTWSPQPDFGNNPCASCSGCCFGGSQCMPGTSVAACGFGGLTCQTCNGTDQCLNGSCVPQAPQCSASTCAGGCCSSAGVCLEPPTVAACGLNGAACKTCGGSEVCQTGVCQTAGPKTYEVTAVSAEVSNADCGGWADSCDAFIEVALGGGAVVKSPFIADSEAPVWDFKLFDATDKELLATQLKVRVADDDGWPNPDDELGVCDLSVTQVELDAGKLVADCGTKVKNVTFTFKLAAQ